MSLVRQFANVICVAVAGCLFAASGQNIITTVAGTDVLFGGEGQPGPAVSLGKVSYVATDPLSGRPVFSDAFYNLIIRVESNGSLHVIAGNNVQGMATAAGASTFPGSGGGYSGDGGPATSAALNRPHGLAFDASGNLYIADTFNNRIRVVNRQGIISTFAGTGAAGYKDGATNAAQFSLPFDVAVNSSGAVYVNDAGNFRVRLIAQGKVSTVAGNGQIAAGPENAVATASPLADVEGLATDAQGNVYISEFAANRVRKITPEGHLVTVAGTGAAPAGSAGCSTTPAAADGDPQPALSATLSGPAGLAVDTTGLYIADVNSQRIRKVSNNTISTLAGSGQTGTADGAALSASFHTPWGIAVSTAGDIYVADRDSSLLRDLTPSNTVRTVAGNGAFLSSANGKPAIFANLLDPFGVSLDSSGNLLIADSGNNVVRRTGSGGSLSIIAGTGAQECSGDNGAATQAGLSTPINANSDSSGNILIADFDNSRIRKLANGNLTTLIGSDTNSPIANPTQAVTDGNGNTYIADYGNNRIVLLRPDGTHTVYKSGLSHPFGVALDGQRNLYVTEFTGGRVTEIRSDGSTITVAGGGALVGRNADGQSATSARLINPAGIALDSTGAVYFTDPGDNTVRRVKNGLITTIAGNGSAGYAGDGGLATSAALRSPYGIAVDSQSGTVYISDTLNNRIRAILTAAPSFAVTPSSLSFTVDQDGPVSDVATVAAAANGVPGLLFTASASQSWISVTPSSGTVAAMPATIQVRIDPTGLGPKTYNETVTVTAPGANPPSQTIALTINVNSSQPAVLDVDTNSINLAFTKGDQNTTQQIQILNRGDKPLQFSFAPSINNGSGWLNAAGSAGGSEGAGSANTSTPTSPGSVSLTISPGNLDPGAYTATLRIRSSGITNNRCAKKSGDDFCDIPVNIVVNDKPGKLVVSETALQFTAVKGAAAPPAKSIDFVNAGSGTLNWTASQQVAVASGPQWLSIDTGSGSLDAQGGATATIRASVNPANLDAGTYYGQVQISSNDALNSPRFVNVVLNVVPATTDPGAEVSAAGVLFVPSGDGGNPSSQTVMITNLSTQPLSFTSSRLTDSGNWLVHVPPAATIPPGQSLPVVVQPDFSNVSGMHQAAITFQFGNGTSKTLNVLGLAPTGTNAVGSLKRGQAEHPGGPRAGSCSAPPAVQLLALPASVQLGQPVSLQAKVVDGCGNTAGSNFVVHANFSSNDRNVNMALSPAGIWTGQWTPTDAKSQVQIAVYASDPVAGVLNHSNPPAVVTVTSPTAALPTGRIANAASYADTPLAPGTFVSIFGAQLASGTGFGTPFSSSIYGTTVMLGGRVLPLSYVSPSQINAQLPYDLPPNTQQTMTIQRSETLSASVDFLIAKAQPAIFTTNAQGFGQGDVYVFRGSTSPLADASNPAKAGDIVTIYCTGLGSLQADVSAGANVSGPTPTVDTPTVTIGGVPVDPAGILYSGLSPGNPGLYQINARVPNGVAAGNSVPVVITMNGQSSSSSVTIAITN